MRFIYTPEVGNVFIFLEDSVDIKKRYCQDRRSVDFRFYFPSRLRRVNWSFILKKLTYVELTKVVKIICGYFLRYLMKFSVFAILHWSNFLTLGTVSFFELFDSNNSVISVLHRSCNKLIVIKGK